MLENVLRCSYAANEITGVPFKQPCSTKYLGVTVDKPCNETFNLMIYVVNKLVKYIFAEYYCYMRNKSTCYGSYLFPVIPYKKSKPYKSQRLQNYARHIIAVNFGFIDTCIID